MNQRSLFNRENPPSRRGRLLQRIRTLADVVLPNRARSVEENGDQGYPVQEDHRYANTFPMSVLCLWPYTVRSRRGQSCTYVLTDR